MAPIPAPSTTMTPDTTTRRLRIGHVTQGLDVGGQEKLLVEFARHARPDQHDLHFISLGGLGPLASSLQEQGWTVSALEAPTGLRPRLVFRLARLFHGLDVVHTHDDRPLVYGAFAARLARIPRVIHTHHHGQLQHISRRQSLLVRWAARLTDRFVCVSQDSARVMEHQGVPAKKVMTLWNGIDLERFAYRGFSPGGPLVTVARLSPEKGIDVLLRAMPLILKTEPGAHLEIAGHGPLRASLERLAEELHLTQRVRFLGEVSDIPALLSKASLFILPSHSEGISLTLLEAMARGLPVVATNVGGNAEVVVDGETGLLVPPNQPGELADVVRQLCGDPDRCQMLGRAGRRRVEAHFDIRRLLEQYDRLYRGQ